MVEQIRVPSLNLIDRRLRLVNAQQVGVPEVLVTLVIYNLRSYLLFFLAGRFRNYFSVHHTIPLTLTV